MNIKGNGIDGYNVSDIYQMSWYAPERTGTRGISEILTHYKFIREGKPIFFNGEYNYSHRKPLDNRYENYKTICSARNPYSRIVSIYKNYVSIKLSFKDFIFNEIYNDNYNIIFNPKIEKQFDYVIKIENPYNDLIKLPFIDDKLSRKQLEFMCQHGKKMDEWESYYDLETKEFVYELLKDQFIYWGYEK